LFWEQKKKKKKSSRVANKRRGGERNEWTGPKLNNTNDLMIEHGAYGLVEKNVYRVSSDNGG